MYLRISCITIPGTVVTISNFFIRLFLSLLNSKCQIIYSQLKYNLRVVGWLVVGFKADCLTRDLGLGGMPSVGVFLYNLRVSKT